MLIEEKIEYLRNYAGKPLKLMEVCGTHTAAIFKSGLRSILSPEIRLISGPGCPVCVTPTAYIDRCRRFANTKGHALISFGDMLKVPGSAGSLSDIRGEGGRVEMVYSPFEVIGKAEREPDTVFVVAAVGFETTAPAYALLLEELIGRGLANVKLLTALKAAIPAIGWVCATEPSVDGFLCPGHVSVITGSAAYGPLAEAHGKPFVIAGFEERHLTEAVYLLARTASEGSETHAPAGRSGFADCHAPAERADIADCHGPAGRSGFADCHGPAERSGFADCHAPAGRVFNLYEETVRPEGNRKAAEITEKYFETGEAVWRGLGILPASGFWLRAEWSAYDAGSRELTEDSDLPAGCRCADVITGRIDPDGCPMFGNVCSPGHAMGPCMVSAEGACGIWYANRR